MKMNVSRDSYFIFVFIVVSNVEYVINIVAFDSRENHSRPSILVISTKESMLIK